MPTEVVCLCYKSHITRCSSCTKLCIYQSGIRLTRTSREHAEVSMLSGVRIKRALRHIAPIQRLKQTFLPQQIMRNISAEHSDHQLVQHSNHHPEQHSARHLEEHSKEYFEQHSTEHHGEGGHADESKKTVNSEKVHGRI